MLNLVCLRTMSLLLSLFRVVHVMWFDEFVELVDMCPNDPHGFAYVSTHGHGRELKSFSPSIVKDEPYTINEGHLCDCCRLA